MTLFLAGVLRVSTVVTTDAWVVALLRVLGLACSEDVHALQAMGFAVVVPVCAVVPARNVTAVVYLLLYRYPLYEYSICSSCVQS